MRVRALFALFFGLKLFRCPGKKKRFRELSSRRAAELVPVGFFTAELGYLTKVALSLQGLREDTPHKCRRRIFVKLARPVFSDEQLPLIRPSSQPSAMSWLSCCFRIPVFTPVPGSGNR